MKRNLILDRETKKLFICCPLQEHSYAGWLFQIRRFAERNWSRADIRFIFAPRNTAKKSSLRKAVSFALNARREICKSQGEMIVLFPGFFFPNMLVALLLPRNIAYVVRISGGELLVGNPMIFWLRIVLLRRARKLIILNADAADRLAALRVSGTTLVPNAVTNSFRPPTDEQRQQAKKNLGLSTDKIVIGHVGTLCKRKQQELLISSATKCGADKVEVLLCGPYVGHPEADPAYFDYCRNLAKAAGVRLVATGQLENMLQAYWAMDIFGFPSISEGMPNALLEAMACSLPCLATDIPGNRDIVRSGESGILVPLSAPREFSARLSELVKNEGARRRLAKAAHARIMSDFSTAAMDEAYSKILGLEA